MAGARTSAAGGAQRFARARGPHYLDVISELHRTRAPAWYLEIGSGRGHSLMRAPGRAIAVDPEPRFGKDVLGDKPELHVFRQTSDDFFASGIAARLTPGIDLAFIDGMHLFEYVLRDFINTERLCRPGSVILLHDLMPFSAAAAARIWDKSATTGWTGDVWKMIPILRDYRPDLEFSVLDPRPTGLGMVSRLDPENTVLQDAYDEIVARYLDMDVEAFGLARLGQLSAVVPAGRMLPGLRDPDTADTAAGDTGQDTTPDTAPESAPDNTAATTPAPETDLTLSAAGGEMPRHPG